VNLGSLVHKAGFVQTGVLFTLGIEFRFNEVNFTSTLKNLTPTVARLSKAEISKI